MERGRCAASYIVQTAIEDQLAKLVLAGTIGDGSEVTFDVAEDHQGLRVV